MGSSPQKNPKQSFSDWLTAHNFKPFEANDDAFDMDFIEEIMASMISYYDINHPILRAESTDQEANGHVIDGRHRLMAIYMAEQKGKKIVYRVQAEHIEDYDQLLLKQAYYDKMSEGKDRKVSMRRQERNFFEILARHPKMTSISSINSYFKEKGYKDQIFVNQWMEKRPFIVLYAKRLETLGFEKNKISPEVCRQTGFSAQWVNQCLGDEYKDVTKRHLTISNDEKGLSHNVLNTSDQGNKVWETPEEGTMKRFQCKTCNSEYLFGIKDDDIQTIQLLVAKETPA